MNRLLALTQGDPAGIGPEILLKSMAAMSAEGEARPVLLAERAGLAAVRHLAPESIWQRLVFFSRPPSRETLLGLAPRIPVIDPVGAERAIELGQSGPADARGAMAALDLGIELARSGAVDALVTAPVAKISIARHALPGFVGHTDYLAARCGLERYGRDYLMAFLSPDLQVALLSVHEPLARAVAGVTTEGVVEALACLARHVSGRFAVAGLNPHAGEGGLIGDEDLRLLVPAVRRAREMKIDAYGPESPDSLFARARRGEFDWVLALYHDQGLVAVKTASFGHATNWTLGLPFLRTSVDHGTAFHIAGQGLADEKPLLAVLDTTLRLLRRDRRRRD
ncbi:MAG: 4-hydroxythreonine-4-phosphate dehydrogenase PdxA [Thermoanaerobaculia bacterium]